MITDFHTHILPGVDDGSDSLKTSVSMLKQQWDQGVRRVVATPHFYPHRDSPERFLRRRERAEALLREEMAGHPDLPELEMGAEVYYYPGISQSEQIAGLTIGKGRWLLVEMPDSPWTDAMYRDLEGLWDRQGLVPIIAHVDRYIRPLRTHGIPDRLAELPVLVQANAGFFLRRNTQKMAMRLLKADRVHLLGSDCHNLDSRSPNLGMALKQIRAVLGPQAVARICTYGNDVWTASRNENR